MRRIVARTSLLSALAALSLSAPTEAYQRLKVGPLEFVPTFSVELRQHSNVYLSSDEQNDLDTRPSSTTDVSGIIIDVRPGMILSLKPKLEKKIRGFYFDLKFAPSVVLFPTAPRICLQPGGCGEDDAGAQEPDTFKWDNNLYLGLRYQTNGRLSLSGGAQYTHPELAATDDNLDDFLVYGGAKYDFSRTMSIELMEYYKNFKTPRDETYFDSVTQMNLSRKTDTAFGSFHSLTTRIQYSWQWRPTLTVGATYDRGDRIFNGIGGPDTDGDGVPDANNFNGDPYPDNFKDYDQQTIRAYATKRLTKQARGTVEFGRTFRDNDQRNFGSGEYNSYVGTGSLETLLTKRTRVQLSAEYAVTDTIREITFTDLNAFTQDQTGQFTVLPEQFSVAYDQRYLLDFIQNVFKRGDQILLGIGYQRDRLVDQLGSQNFFVPGQPFVRDLAVDAGCEFDENGNPFNCDTVLSDSIQKNFLVTSGYRYRPRRYTWLGLQVRGTYYRGEATPVITDAHQNLVDEAGARPLDPTPVKTRYWSVAGGLVINLQVFQ